MTPPEGETQGEPRFVGRAPGRLDIMGGNGSYTGVLAVESTTREGVWATVGLREDRRILFFNPQMCELGWDEQAEFSLDDLEDDERVRQLAKAAPGICWTAYVLGAFYLLKEWFPDRIVRGANVYIKSDLPLGKGAGSSAAVEVAVMKTAGYAYGVELSGIELAAACHWVENIIAESTCGIIDQITSVLGETDHLLPVLCQDCLPRAPFRLPGHLQIWGVASSGAIDRRAEQEAARVAAFMAYKLICDWEGAPVQFDESAQIPRWTDRRWNGYLSNVTTALFRSNYEHRLPEAITGAAYLENGQTHVDPFTQIEPERNYHVRACARFAVEENERARLFVHLARAGTGFEEMGELMYQSHYGYTECGLGCESADRLVSLVCEEGASSGLYGARITGRGAGGVVAVLGRRDASRAFQRVLERFGESPYVFEGSSMGADRYGVLTA